MGRRIYVSVPYVKGSETSEAAAKSMKTAAASIRSSILEEIDTA